MHVVRADHELSLRKQPLDARRRETALPLDALPRETSAP
jgi:hypothetical protein